MALLTPALITVLSTSCSVRCLLNAEVLVKLSLCSSSAVCWLAEAASMDNMAAAYSLQSTKNTNSRTPQANQSTTFLWDPRQDPLNVANGHVGQPLPSPTATYQQLCCMLPTGTCYLR